MKFLVSSFLVASAIVAFAAESPVTGKWQIHISIAGYEGDLNCTLTEKEGDLSGTCNSDQGTVNVAGKVDGKAVTFTYKSEYNGSPITVQRRRSKTGVQRDGVARVSHFDS
jgi:hypothetical protein